MRETAATFGAIAVLTLASFFSVWTAFPRVPVDDLVVAEPVTDLGRIRQGQVGRAEFVTLNDSDRRVTITNILTSCSCTVVDLGVRDIEPGRTARIRADFDTKSYRGPSSTCLSIVYRLASRSEERTKHVWIKAEVDPDFEVTPPVLEFEPDGEKSRVVSLVPKNMPELIIKSAYCTHPAYKAKVVAPVAGRSDWGVEVTVDPDRIGDGLGLPSAYLVVHSNSVNEPIYQHRLKYPARKELSQ